MFSFERAPALSYHLVKVPQRYEIIIMTCLTIVFYSRLYHEGWPRVPAHLDRPEQADRGRGLRARHRHDQLQADGLQEGGRLLPGKLTIAVVDVVYHASIVRHTRSF